MLYNTTIITITITIIIIISYIKGGCGEEDCGSSSGCVCHTCVNFQGM